MVAISIHGPFLVPVDSSEPARIAASSQGGLAKLDIIQAFWKGPDAEPFTARRHDLLVLTQRILPRRQNSDSVAQHVSYSPPATMISSPLIHRESSEARNTTGNATSSGSPIRPRGVSAT